MKTILHIAAFIHICALSKCYVHAEYWCLCSYDNDVNVYATPNVTSVFLGNIPVYDCKPTYEQSELQSGNRLFITIQYGGMVGYVPYNTSIVQYQSCIGDPPGSDIVTSPASTVATTMSQSACPLNEPWHAHGNSCYLFKVNNDDKRTWASAQEKCFHDNSHLVFIESQAEQDYIRTTLQQLFVNASKHDNRAWIGASDKDHEGNWKWIVPHHSNRHFGPYMAWAHGEPNNNHGEDCGELQGDNDYLWNDQDCGNSQGYICELERWAEIALRYDTPYQY